VVGGDKGRKKPNLHLSGKSTRKRERGLTRLPPQDMEHKEKEKGEKRGVNSV